MTGFVPEVGFGNGRFASLRWPANKRERDGIFDPFLSPRNIICFGTQQAVFSVTRNRFRNRKQLARKGVENSSEVVVFYRAPRVPKPISKRSTGPRLFHSKSAPQSLVFTHYRTQKRGKSCRICPGKRLDSIQFFENKIPDLQFSFGSSERFLMIRLHKIGRYNTRFPAHQKEVSSTY